MKLILKILIVTIISTFLLILLINTYIIEKTKNNIKTIEFIDNKDIDCIIVLGAGIRGEKPSPMLEDRLLAAIKLYKKGIAKKIIVSGDHGSPDYDEVNVMKNYLIENKIASEDIFMDHAGFSTYDTLYRAKNVFNVENVILVTQEYHLYRAIYISKKLGISTSGFSADKRVYSNQKLRDIRESIARFKDFFKCIIKPKSKYLGDNIPVNGNGNITNDK